MNTTLLIVLPVLAAFSLAFYKLIKAGKNACGADWGYAWMNVMDGLIRLYCSRYHRLGNGMLDLPATGPAIVVSNHVSGLDPLLLIAASKRPLRFLIAREQYERFGLQWLFKEVGCIPVDRKGRPDTALRAARQALKDGEIVALFPHGKIHLDSDPPRRLKPGAVMLARLAKCRIVPTRISGIRGEGHVLPSLLFRCNANVKRLPILDAQDTHHDVLTRQLESILNNTEASSSH